MLVVESYSSTLVNAIIQDPSIDIGRLKWNDFFGLVSLNSNVSSALLCVCSISVSQFLVVDSKYSV